MRYLHSGRNIDKTAPAEYSAVQGTELIITARYALEATGPLKGKTVIDATNPLEWNPNGRMVRSLPGSTTAGEELAKKLPDALVVKAFRTTPTSFIPHAFTDPFSCNV